MSNVYKLAIIPGDGIGPEVVNEGLKILEVVSKKYDFKVETTAFPFGGEHYMKTGEVLSDSAIEELRKFDAIYLGAVGHPDVKPGILEKGILLKLRFDFEQYINLRPVKLYENVETPLKNKTSKDINYTVVRENTGGLYVGEGSFTDKDTADEVAVQKMIYSRKQVDRCLRYAFELVKKNHSDNPWEGLTQQEKDGGFIGKLTMCGKTNVLTYAFDLWDRAFQEMAKEYPNVIADYVHVDAVCIYMVESPERFNVIVTGNMFGDIITDLAAVTQGGMGVAPSGNINPKGTSMFEPVHGSAPQFTGKNVINPIAAIATLSMMLNYLGEKEAAVSVESAMRKIIKEMKSMLVGQMGYSTSEIGDMIVEALA
ncbi:3-isopropylmalate dehydrogenase [hydrothermal vent metagenome]|uniref:3-isopropylmalate dehydrogenase n=1 Tax=hydrothermal vent metagenome TaxID=652676 RepID=A0A3B1E0S4_9ZZZZ